MTVNLRQRYIFRLVCSGVLALILAMVVGYLLDYQQMMWAVCGALLVMPTTHGTPVRQGFVIIIAVLLAVIAGFILGHYIMQIEWTGESERVLSNRVVLIMAGGCGAILCRLIIAPVRQYLEFSRAIVLMLDVLLNYSNELQRVIVNGGKIDSRLLNIQYPEWVFEYGFNRNFRGSFRYVLVQLDRIIEAFYSLDYYIKQPVDADLMTGISPEFAGVVAKNGTLLNMIRVFFANEGMTKSNENFISDVTDIHNALQVVLPENLEMLDVSPDYTIISAMARDVIDIREILLQILAGLPVDDIQVTE